MKVLEYRFAVAPIFHFIANKSMEAGLHLCDGHAKQTVQLFILIRREDSHFNEAKRSKWEMNRLNYILLKIG
ncbi:hypothetical protein [Geobacillus stearothermophilus]|uniref:Uncharacterized protein n=2 Tax=Geobacillus TaxID=129337 RepID=A0A3L7D7W7_GEOSE|nr:hypothetical protein [Geobacillus stearothermophilus]RLQ04903.1 hypothetical protein D9549_15640 [Geobacillus stearothermophilus]RLQ05136.1 hypothetical protein D9547_15265 [Geobacillus stearothermophilus]RLQ12826.1 hypothetical protein D9548_15500 [Geobacillus stearothermophilus]